jgi:putative endonuclease
MHRYFVYILASKSRRLYIGVTNDLLRRVFEHQKHLVLGFTAQYRIHRLVYFEETDYVHAALAREKEIKGWRREKKVVLIEGSNPTWEDLSNGWYDSTALSTADSSLRSE